MGMSMKVGFRPRLLADEKIYHRIRSVGYATSKSPPSYRVTFPIPLLMRCSLILTDHRMLSIVYMFGLRVGEFYAWYPECAPEGDGELIKRTCVGRNRWIGPYLEIVTLNEHRTGWMSRCLSPEIRLRIYMRNPQPLCEIVRRGLCAGSGAR